MIRDRTVSLYLFHKKYNINIPTRKDCQIGQVPNPVYSGVCYTDGLKSESEFGATVYHVTFQVGHSYKLVPLLLCYNLKLWRYFMVLLRPWKFGEIVISLSL